MEQYHSETLTPDDFDTPAPLPMNSIQDFEKKYKKGELILSSDDFILYLGEDKDTKEEVIIKEYKQEFVSELKDYKDLFDIERSYFNNFNKNNFKYICELINSYKTNEKIIFVFEKFSTTLKNELIKKKFKIEEITTLLLKINEILKYFSKRQIQEVIFSPETIAINKKDDSGDYTLKIFNLFPYHKLKQKDIRDYENKSFFYISKDFPTDVISKSINFSINNCFDDKIPKIVDNQKYLQAILWDLGVLMYELHFGELPSNILKKSGSKEFDDLIVKLLEKNEEKRIRWKDYLSHKLFLTLEPEKVFKIILDKNIEKSCQEIDMHRNEIDNYNFEILMKIDFQNLIVLNLADNYIENLELPNNNLNIFKNLKFLNLEKNKLNGITKSFLKEIGIGKLEYLFLAFNNIIGIKEFSGINLDNLNYLSLSHNNIYDITPLSEAGLKNLNVLNLSFNKIKDISSLQKINSEFLEELKLNNNDISDIKILEKTNFKKLKILDLKENQIDKIYVLEKASFPNLEILDLSKNKINNINPISNASFTETLKELYLSDNPIRDYDSLKVNYFPSLTKIRLLIPYKDDIMKYQLKILSIKLRLYGYELKKQNNNNKNQVSILITPFNLIKNWENLESESFDYTNSFKIVTNINSKKDDIINFFFDEKLEMTDYEKNNNKNLILFEPYSPSLNEIKEENEINNYFVLSYIDDNNIINEKIKTNTLYLLNQYEKQYERTNKYEKIPSYINSKTSLSKIKEFCPFMGKIENNNLHKIIVDDKESFYSFLKMNNYYNYFPIIFINYEYYQGFLKYLNKSPKYANFKNKNIFIELLIPSDKKYAYNHFYNINPITEIAEIVENKDFYAINDIIKKIDTIKSETKGNYKEIINDFLITIFEILNECFLFVLNIKLCYGICPICNTPILYVYNPTKKKNQINQENIKEDKTLYKSILFCNNLMKVISQSFNATSIFDYKKKYFGDNPKIYPPANPPKKDINKFINVIYHDENYSNFSKYINDDAIEFRKYTNGTFIFSNCLESFNLIIDGIKGIKDANIKFLLITTGSTFENIYNILNEKGCKDLISKCCIYCIRKNVHINKLNNPEYSNFLEAIFTKQEEVDNYIVNNSEENIKVFEVLKLVTYKDYIKEFYKLHEKISKYYIKYTKTENHESYTEAITLLKEWVKDKNTKLKENNLYKGLKIFQVNNDKKIIREYTKNFIYKDINNWLLNLNNEAYDKIGYFVGELMVKLNEYGKRKNKGYKEKNHITLYRGINVSYLDALSYQIHKGKKICFQTFFSTSIKPEKAFEFKKEGYDFFIFIEIDHYWEDGLEALCFDISSISKYKSEAELLFHPFSFFRIKDVSVDYNTHIVTLKLESINKKDILEEKLRDDNNKKIHYNKIDKIIEIKDKSNKDSESENEDDD